jgi:hypothetical protein
MSEARRALTLAALLAIPACSRDVPGERGASHAPPVLPPGSAASAPSLVVPVAAGDSLAVAARARVQAWSRALDAHDLAALEPLYARNLCLYGRVMSRARVVAAKRAALGPQSTFHQEIVGDVSIRPQTDGAAIALFTKLSGAKDHLREVRAKLVLIAPGDAGSLEIVEEADAPQVADSDERDGCEAEAEHATAASSSRGSRGAPSADACEATVNGVVQSLSLVKAFYEEAKAAVEAGAIIGSTGPENDGDSELTSAIGFNNPDRFEPHVVYVVNLKTGTLEVSVDGQDTAPSNEAAKAIAAACKR